MAASPGSLVESASQALGSRGGVTRGQTTGKTTGSLFSIRPYRESSKISQGPRLAGVEADMTDQFRGPARTSTPGSLTGAEESNAKQSRIHQHRYCHSSSVALLVDTTKRLTLIMSRG